MSKKRLRTTAPASKSDPAYWRARLFRNAFTYQGRRVEVRAWSVKMQLFGKRKSFTLSSPEPAQAAGEACQIYRTLLEQGWEAVAPDGVGRRPASRSLRSLLSPASISQDAEYWKRRLIQRKYPDAAFATAREFSVRIEHARTSRFFPLGTDDEIKAADRALEIYRAVVQDGWDRANAVFPCELSVALRWQDNPVAWTYFTIHTRPGRGVSRPLSPPTTDTAGHRVAFIEPDAGIRRAMVTCANTQPGFRCESSFADAGAALREIPRRRVDLLLVNHDLPDDADAARLEELHRLRPELAVVAYSVFEDSDQLFKSTPGGSMLYMLRRTTPDRLFEPLDGLAEPPTRERIASQVSKYFQRWAAQLPSGPPAWKLARLTPREHEILDCLSKGDLLKEVAFKLGISNWTVQGHVKRIFEKLKVHTRTEAVVKYLQK